MTVSYNVQITFADGRIWDGAAVQLQKTAPHTYEGLAEGIRLQMQVGDRICIRLQNTSGAAVTSLGWQFHAASPKIACCRVPLACSDVRHSGVVTLDGSSPKSSLFTGLFYGADKPCLFFGTQLPQNNLHDYCVSRQDDDHVIISGTTQFTQGQSVREQLVTETTIMIHAATPLQAMQRYASHLPVVPDTAPPMVGWNSWDYYFTTISADAVRENLEVIVGDPVLKNKLKAVVVDDGWETCVGEWYANHRFPEGLPRLAEMIREYGLIPGIWTNGAQTESLCEPGLRHPEYYIKDEFGIPLTSDGKCILDPTHPATQQFILDTYSRLYQAGFRIFKVDFISTIATGTRFYDPACGPYEAIRRLIALIRQAVGPDSHIIGCSFPPECGPGVVDSSRISVDIHNHWLHVLWIMEYMQARFWCNERLFRSDPDMLIVRGSETSLEEETNVFNPWNLVPPGQDRFSSRWRRGPVFNYHEAETWANLVVFSGGDIMLGDRLAMLNSRGLDLIYSHLTPHEHAAVPLDLGDGEAAQFWYDSHTNSLLLVNTDDKEQELEFAFSRFGLTVPGQLSCDKPYKMNNGVLSIPLSAHESAVICW